MFLFLCYFIKVVFSSRLVAWYLKNRLYFIWLFIIFFRKKKKEKEDQIKKIKLICLSKMS